MSPAEDVTAPPPDGGGANRRLSAALRDALAQERRLLTSLDDPVEILTQATEFFATLDTQAAEMIGTLRIAAIADLRQRGWSHQQIADACGLTRQRVSQLIRDSELAG